MSVQRWIAAYIQSGIDEVIRKKPVDQNQADITDEDKEIILSMLFNDPHLFGYIRNTWSLSCWPSILPASLGVPISFEHLNRITKGLGIRCNRKPKLKLLHVEDYEE